MALDYSVHITQIPFNKMNMERLQKAFKIAIQINYTTNIKGNQVSGGKNEINNKNPLLQ